MKDLIKILKGLSHAHIPDCLNRPEMELAVRRQEEQYPGSGEGPPEARAARRGWRRVADGGSRKATSPRPGHPASWYHHFQGQEPWASALTIATLLRTLRQVKAARKGGETQRKINREKMNLRWCRFLEKQLGTCSYSCSGILRKATHLVQPFIPGIYQKEGS